MLGSGYPVPFLETMSFLRLITSVIPEAERIAEMKKAATS
jgi:hypothetical protein